MRSLPLTISLAAVASLTGAAVAQNALFEIYPGVTSFTSRGNIGGGFGELHQGFHSTINRGLGDKNGVCELRGVRSVLQDQNQSTQGTWRYFIRSGDETNGPGTTPADVIANTGPLTFPASTLTTGVAYLFTTTFTTPIAVPCESFWSIGVELPTDTWSSDGVSIHASANTAHLQHANAEDIAWQIIGAATAATHPSSKRSWRVGAIVETALQGGNIDSSATPATVRYGIGGYFPDTAAVGALSQGLSFKVTHPSGATGGVTAVFLSIGYGAQTAIPGFGNSVYLNLPLLAPFAVVQGPADGSEMNFIPPGLDLLPPGGGINVVLQGVVVDTANSVIDMTNAVSVVLH